MERESTKHGPRTDDAMKHDVAPLTRATPVEAHTRDARLQEGPAEGEAPIDPGHRPDAGPVAGLTSEEIDARSELARHLERCVFPADRDSLVRSAADTEAPDVVLAKLRRLPAGRRFGNVQQIWESLGGHREASRR